MKTFSDFILEARGESAEQIAKMRREAQAAMRAGNMDRYTELAQEIKELESAEKIERERTQNQPAHKSTQPTPGGGRPQIRNRDNRGSSGSLANIPSTAGENSGTSVGGRFGDRGSGKPGSTLRDKGTGRSGGHLGVKYP